MTPDRVADLLVARGYAEAITYSFVDPALEEAGQSRRRAASSSRIRSRATWPCCGARCGRGSSNAARQNVAHQRQRVAAVRDRAAVRSRRRRASRRPPSSPGFALGSARRRALGRRRTRSRFLRRQRRRRSAAAAHRRAARVSLRGGDASRVEPRPHGAHHARRASPSAGSARCIPELQKRHRQEARPPWCSRCNSEPAFAAPPCRRSAVTRSFRRSGAISRSSWTTEITAADVVDSALARLPANRCGTSSCSTYTAAKG